MRSIYRNLFSVYLFGILRAELDDQKRINNDNIFWYSAIVHCSAAQVYLLISIKILFFRKT